MTDRPDAFWAQYFDEVCRKGPSWLDYSNERVHLQTLGATIEASDHVAGKRTLDVGCGGGHLCRVFHALGAREVVGIDPVASAIEKLSREHPAIVWKHGDLMDEPFRRGLGEFDLVTLLEVMQYLPVREALAAVWDRLLPGGRLVAIFPNEQCPIVRRTVERFGGKYVAPSLQTIVQWASSAPRCHSWALRGFAFQQDQSIVPYAMLPWSREIPREDPPPNRLQLVVAKSEHAG